MRGSSMLMAKIFWVVKFESSAKERNFKYVLILDLPEEFFTAFFG